MATVTIGTYSFNNGSAGPPAGTNPTYGYGYGTLPGQIGISFAPLAVNRSVTLTPGVRATVPFATVTQNEGASDFYHVTEGTNGVGVRNADGTATDPQNRLRVPVSFSVSEGADTRTMSFEATVGNGVDLYVGSNAVPDGGTVSDAAVDYRLALGSRTVQFANGDTLQIDLSTVALSGNPESQVVQASLLLTADDYPDTPSTPGTVGLRTTGRIEAAGDRDSFRVDLAAGQTYAFVARGQGASPLPDPVMELRSGSGTVLQSNDDAFGLNPAITFTAATSGTYFLSVGGYSDRIGTYAVAVLPTAPGGTAGADVLTDDAGNTRYDAGAGQDVLALAGAGFRATAVVAGLGGAVMLAHDGQVDVAVGVEEIRFIDGRLVFDPSDPAVQVARLYQAGLGRAPDQGGLNFWTASIQRGVPLSALADGFLTSSEFTGRFGTDLPNQAFVTRIYQNVLGRDPEAGGLAFWTGSLDRGVSSRGAVLAGISESTENRNATAALVAAGVWDRSEAAGQMARLYDTVLGRLPDAAGLAYWAGELDARATTLPEIAQSFAGSAEFAATYGALGNRAFVERLYGNTLGRAGDADGVAYWAGALDSGATRAAVALGFSESPEHQNRTAPAVGGDARAEWGVRLLG